MQRPSTAPLRTAVTWVKAWFSGYPGWVGGVLAGLQGALGPYLAVTILALAVIASDPGPATMDGIPWGSAFSVATTVFLMAHGVPAITSIGTLTLLPLGLTVMSAAATVALARRFATRTWTSWGLAVASYVAMVGLIGSLALAGRPDGGSLIVRACTVAALVAAPSVAAGIWRAHGAEFGWATQLPAWCWRGARRGVATLAWCLGLAALTALVFAIAGRDAIADSATALGVDGVGGLVLAIGELAYAPTLIVWMLAWLTGQGFSVGVGSSYAPDAVAVGALPEVPLLGALPATAGGLLVWAPLTIVAAAVAVRAVTRLRGRLTWDDVRSDAVALAVVAAAGLTLFAIGAGAIGPGRLAESVGADLIPTTTALSGLVLAGYLLVTGAHAAVDAVVRWRAARQPAKPTSAPAPARTPHGATATDTHAAQEADASAADTVTTPS